MKALRAPAIVAALAVSFGALLVLSPAEGKRRRSSHENPRTEIVARVRVETESVRRVHRNRREFEELDVTIESFERAKDGARVGDPDLPVETGKRVHVVHDLTCGGEWRDLKVGDRAEIKGEYVAATDHRDILHFTHPAGGACGPAGGHPDGYIRKLE